MAKDNAPLDKGEVTAATTYGGAPQQIIALSRNTIKHHLRPIGAVR